MANMALIQEKGGCAKSTTAQQIAATYNLARHGASQLLEQDDQNMHCAFLTSSAIEAKQVKLGSENRALEAAQELLVSLRKPTVIDLGGNRTCTVMSREMAANGLLELQDLIMVPVTNPDIEVMKARNVLEMLDEVAPHVRRTIVIARTYQDIRNPADDSILDGAFRTARSLAQEFKIPREHILIFPHCDAVWLCRDLGMTVYEAAMHAPEALADISKSMRELALAGRTDELGSLGELKAAYSKAVEALPLIQHLHSKIDRIIGVDAAAQPAKAAKAK